MIILLSTTVAQYKVHVVQCRVLQVHFIDQFYSVEYEVTLRGLRLNTRRPSHTDTDDELLPFICHAGMNAGRPLTRLLLTLHFSRLLTTQSASQHLHVHPRAELLTRSHTVIHAWLAKASGAVRHSVSCSKKS